MNEREIEAAIAAIKLALTMTNSNTVRTDLHGALDHLEVELRQARRQRGGVL